MSNDNNGSGCAGTFFGFIGCILLVIIIIALAPILFPVIGALVGLGAICFVIFFIVSYIWAAAGGLDDSEDPIKYTGRVNRNNPTGQPYVMPTRVDVPPPPSAWMPKGEGVGSSPADTTERPTVLRYDAGHSPTPPVAVAAAGWYVNSYDPPAAHILRWWDGSTWT